MKNYIVCDCAVNQYSVTAKTMESAARKVKSNAFECVDMGLENNWLCVFETDVDVNEFDFDVGLKTDSFEYFWY